MRDDVVQEVFMVVHVKLHTLEHPESGRRLVGVARRKVSRHHRKSEGNECGIDVIGDEGMDDLASAARLRTGAGR